MSDYTPQHSANTPDPVVGDAPPSANVWLSDKAYNILKFVAQILLPGLGTLYYGLAGIWGLPSAQEVVGTVVVVDTFLGLFLGASSRQYNNTDARFDGSIGVEPGENEDTTNLNVSLDPQAVASKKEITVKINRS